MNKKVSRVTDTKKMENPSMNGKSHNTNGQWIFNLNESYLLYIDFILVENIFFVLIYYK